MMIGDGFAKVVADRHAIRTAHEWLLRQLGRGDTSLIVVPVGQREWMYSEYLAEVTPTPITVLFERYKYHGMAPYVGTPFYYVWEEARYAQLHVRGPVRRVLTHGDSFYSFYLHWVTNPTGEEGHRHVVVGGKLAP